MITRKYSVLAGVACGLAMITSADAQRVQGYYGNPDRFEEGYDIEASMMTMEYVSNGQADPMLFDFFSVSRDPLGNILWANRYGTFDFEMMPAEDFGYTLTEELNGAGWYLGGTTLANSQFLPTQLANMIIHIDNIGNVVWARQYVGSLFTDVVHGGYLTATSDPGTSIIQSRDNLDLYMTGQNTQAVSGLGLPIVLRANPAGAFVLAADYRLADIESVPAFTDIVEIPSQDGVQGSWYAVSGSLLRPTGERDVLLTVLNAGLQPVAVRVYDQFLTKDGAQFPASSTGHSIAYDPATRLIAIAGTTDFGYGPLGPIAASQYLAPHVLLIDPSAGFMPVQWTAYDPELGAPIDPAIPLRTWEADYATVDFRTGPDGNQRVAVGGTYFEPDVFGRHAMFEADLGGMLIWSMGYEPDTVGRGLDPAVDCGVAGNGAGGVFPDQVPGQPFVGPLAEHFAKTNDVGKTGCNEGPIPLFEIQLIWETLEPELLPNFLDGDQELFIEQIPGALQALLCQSNVCTDPCPGDVNGDKSVDVNDLLIVLNQFGMTGPGLQGDLNGDNSVDVNDLLIVLFNFGTVCP